jgi:hydrogenase nickel incorporation protein HypA/HybF
MAARLSADASRGKTRAFRLPTRRGRTHRAAVHEFSIAEGALRVVTEHLRARRATRVHSVTLRVGALSGVVPDALTFAFDALARDTPAAGARLVIEEVPVACYCAACAHEFAAEPGCYHCPACGTLSTEVRRGQELDVMSLEVS